MWYVLYYFDSDYISVRIYLRGKLTFFRFSSNFYISYKSIYTYSLSTIRIPS